MADPLHEHGAVEVGVGDRGEQPVHHKLIGGFIRYAGFACTDRIIGYAFQHEEEQVLQVGDVACFAAYALDSAAGAFGRFLALETEHIRHK
ncbi:hypothetical protein D3C73_1276410 [compost metagenome]